MTLLTPTAVQDEVLEYAKWLGIDTEADKDLLWIAREGLKVWPRKNDPQLLPAWWPRLRRGGERGAEP